MNTSKTPKVQYSYANGSANAIWMTGMTYPSGNWMYIKQDDNGNGTCDLVQLRNCNKVNEITDISNTTGSAWATASLANFSGRLEIASSQGIAAIRLLNVIEAVLTDRS